MKILLFSQYFKPEIGALASRSYENSKEWARKGHNVTILSQIPNYPTGEIYKGYTNSFIQKEEREGVKVIRTWALPSSNNKNWKRILNYVSFAKTSFWQGLFQNPEIIIGSSPQLLTALSAFLVSKIKNTPFVFEIRDFWPESISASDVNKNTFLFKILNSIVNFLYQNSDLIIVIADSAKKYLIQEKGIKKGKIKVIPNGVNLDFFNPKLIKKNKKIIKEYNLKNKFVVSYIGTIGEAQGLEVIMDVAENLRTKKEIVFLLIGEGSKKSKLKKIKNEKKLKNVLFIDQQPKAKIPEFLKISNLSFIHLKDRKIFKATIPSKVFESMAMEKAIILGVKGETKRIIQNARAGLTVEPENKKNIQQAILNLYENKDLISNFGENGRELVKKKYDRKKIAINYLEELEKIL